MTHPRIKILAACLIIFAALGYLAYAGIKQGWVYYVDVDVLLSNPQYQSQRIRLCGRVSPENFHWKSGQYGAQFSLLGKSHSLPISYSGTVPELFKINADVVLEGQLDPSGTFQADLLMTKCASKYQSEEHAKRIEPQPQTQPQP